MRKLFFVNMSAFKEYRLLSGFVVKTPMNKVVEEIYIVRFLIFKKPNNRKKYTTGSIRHDISYKYNQI